MKKARQQYINECEISSLRQVELNGHVQKILVEGYQKGTPVMVFLHGGPGYPMPFCVGARGLFPQLTKHFTAVYWDQLGCGINNYKITNSFHIQDFVDMTVELLQTVKTEFPDEKLYLFGMSWGSVLALKAAERVPELINGVFTVGQVVLPPLISNETIEEVLSSKAPASAKERVRALHGKKDLDLEEMTFLSKTVRKYTGAYGADGAESEEENDFIVKSVFQSKDYKFRHKIACFFNGYRKNGSLMYELSKINLSETLKGIGVPYYVFGGEKDLVTPVKDVLAVIEGANNPNLHCKVEENEAHFPSLKCFEDIFKEVVKAAQ